MRALVVAALLLLAPLALPPGGADHAFSHRVEVMGRAIDADGRPVPGASLSLELEGATSLGGCLDVRDERTNEQGDFHLCRHVHDVPEDVTAVLSLGNTTVSVSVDPRLRRAYVPLILDESWPVRSIQGERAFGRTFLVTGRLVDAQREPVEIEAIEVNATPRGGSPVNVSLLDAEGRVLANGTTTTSGSGDYSVELTLATVPPAAHVSIRAAGVVREAEAPADLRRVDISIVRETTDPYRGPPPGANPGNVPAAGVLASLLVLALASALAGTSGKGPGRRRP